MKPLFALLVLAALLLFPVPLLANWTACLAPYAPGFFFAADKSRGLLFQLGGESAPAVSRVFPCIHGRAEGDKQKQGDLRTPEGVYFITRKITQPLDFMEYGPHAFALNYPNPVDRIRRKTGGGIWLHSKGQPIAGIKTRGCLAIEQEDICGLVSVLAPGTPLLIAERLGGVPFASSAGQLQSSSAPLPAPSGMEMPAGPSVFFSSAEPREQCSLEDRICPPEEQEVQNRDAEEIHFLSGLWIRYWQEARETIFTLYDRARFPAGNREKLSGLRARLRKSFRTDERLAENVRVLQGPGYWVSCFSSRSRTGDVWTDGLYALYWMPGKNGSFLIVGEIFIRR